MVSCLGRLFSSSQPGHFALMAKPSAILRGFPGVERPDVWALDEPFMVAPAVVYFAKDHPLVKRFSVYLQRLHIAGLVSHSFQKSLPKLWKGKPVSPRPLGIRELRPVLSLVARLILPIPFACFILELVWGHIFKRKH